MMLQVIFLHICLYGGYGSVAKNDLSSIHKAVFYLSHLSSRCPVYVYILIFGYFSVTSNKTLDSIKGKALKIYLPMLFYSLFIPFIGKLLGFWQLSSLEKARAFFPFTSRIWYFMTLYLLVLILSPFLNKALTSLSKKEYTRLIVILFLMFSVWTVFAQLSQTGGIIRLNKIFDESGKNLHSFIYMYILGGYLRLHIPCRKKRRYIYLIIFASLTIINAALCYLVNSYSGISTQNNNPFVVLQCVCLMLFFRSLNFKSRVINYIATVNLGVYMIHEQFLMRNKLWHDWCGFLSNKSFYVSWAYPIKIILICLTVFTICGIIEIVRVWLFKGVKMLVQKIYDYKNKAGLSNQF